MTQGANCCSKFVVYLLIFCNIGGGILLLGFASYFYSQHDDSSLNGFLMFAAMISICLGLLLLYGAVKKNARCVLVYWVLFCIGAIIRTGFIIQQISQGVLGWPVVFPIVITWLLVYYVYLFYKSLVEENEVLKSDRPDRRQLNKFRS